MKINDEFYKPLLESVDCLVDEDGNVSVTEADLEPMILTVKGDRLVLPTDDLVRAGKWDGLVPFHPLSEDMLTKESVVFQRFRDLAATKVTKTLVLLMEELMELGVNREKQKKMDPKHAELLSAVKDADEKTLGVLTKVLDLVTVKDNHKLISFYSKVKGLWKGEEYGRVSVITFPITDAYENPDHTIFGVKMRAKDKQSILSLFNFIFPDSRGTLATETYGYGSRSIVAPAFHALCHSIAVLLNRLNEVTTAFRKHLVKTPKECNLEWVALLDDLSKYRDRIPALKGNRGEPVVDALATPEQPVGVHQTVAPQPVRQNGYPMQPQPAPRDYPVQPPRYGQQPPPSRGYQPPRNAYHDVQQPTGGTYNPRTPVSVPSANARGGTIIPAEVVSEALARQGIPANVGYSAGNRYTQPQQQRPLTGREITAQQQRGAGPSYNRGAGNGGNRWGGGGYRR